MKDRNLINSISERIKSKVSGWNKKTIQRVSYTAVFVAVLALVTISYTTADSTTQVSLPGVAGGNDIDVNLLQGQKVEQVNQANAVAASISESTGGQLASGASSADTSQPTTSTGAVTTADDVKAANVASSVAEMVNLSSSSSVSSNAESANISAELAQADATSVNKQQIIETTDDVTTLLAQHTVVEGENVETIAAEYNVKPETIRWANNLKDNNVAANSTITVPTVDGVVYTTKDGDTLESIANKYQSKVDDIININDLDSEVVPTGTKLLLPDGVLPENERPEYVAPVTRRQTTTYTGGGVSVRSNMYVPTASSNRYAYGYCTWYAFNRRVQLGLPVASGWGNANTWDYYASLSGYRVDSIPSVGAIFQTKSGYYGHVGIVERVNPDGTIYVSEMNYGGWNVISHRTITNLSGYKFIH